KMVWGRWLYAVGGNPEGARRTGVPVKGVPVQGDLLGLRSAGSRRDPVHQEPPPQRHHPRGLRRPPDEVTAIKAGDETATVAQHPKLMGSLGPATLVKAIQGKKVPK